MAKICPMKGCKGKPGMCIHEKMMLGIAVIAVVVLIVRALM